MTRGLLFWITMLLWLVFSVWWAWPAYPVIGGSVILWVLLALLGWHCFGAPIKG